MECHTMPSSKSRGYLAIFAVLMLIITAACSPPPDGESDDSRTGRIEHAATTIVVTNTNDTGAGSLRDAILQARANGGNVDIHFNIPGPGPHTLRPAEPYPAITGPNTHIRGDTQPGAACWSSMLIEIDASAMSRAWIDNGSVAIFSMNGGSGSIRGLVMNNMPDTTTLALNTHIAVRSDNNKIQCNYFGTDVTGETLVPGHNGIVVYTGRNTLIGVDTSDVTQRNLISGQRRDGIRLYNAQDTRVSGNWIGVNRTGQRAIPNNTGILTLDAQSTAIIGVPSQGDNSSPALRNLISGNDVALHLLEAAYVLVAGNDIGVAADHATPLGNGAGIVFGDTVHAMVGGGVDGTGNVIAHQRGPGIELRNRTARVEWQRNALFGNGQDLFYPNGGDFNGRIQAPTNTTAIRYESGQIRTLHVSLDVLADDLYRVDFYDNRSCIGSRWQGGQTWLGSVQFFNDPTTPLVIRFNSLNGLRPNAKVTATLTNVTRGTTSAFSGCTDFQIATQTTLTVAPSTVALGDPVIATASVTSAIENESPLAPKPTGTVVISDGDSSCTATVTDGVGSCELRFTTTGLKIVRADYMGADPFRASNSPPVNLIVNRADALFNSTISHNANTPPLTVPAGEEITFYVQHRDQGSLAPPTGTITLQGLCTITLMDGRGSCAVSLTTLGTLTVSSLYSGDSNYRQSSTSTVFPRPTIVAGPIASMTSVSGAAQQTIVATAFDEPLSVILKDAYDNPIRGAVVAFDAVPASSGAGAQLSHTTATTNAKGIATVTAVANQVAGPHGIMATNGTYASEFQLHNVAGPPHAASIVQGSPQSAAVMTPFPLPLTLRVTDAFNNPTAGVRIDVTAPASGPTASLDASQLQTDDDGTVTIHATAQRTAGTYTISASIRDSQIAALSFALTNLAGPPAQFGILEGSEQAAVVGESFVHPLTVFVHDAYDNPVPNVATSFSEPQSGASATLRDGHVTTDETGLASTVATANTIAGSYVVEALLPGLHGFEAPLRFALENEPGPPAELRVAPASSPQSARVTHTYGEALAVTVLDDYGNAVPDVTVTFAAPATGASALLDADTVQTDAAGRAQVHATANDIAAAFNVVASILGLEATFQLANLHEDPAFVVAATTSTEQHADVETAFPHALTVHVHDAYGNPAPGVTVTFATPTSGASANLDAYEATTDAQGTATVHASANAFHGTYEVAATIVAGATPATLRLTNLPRPTDTTLHLQQDTLVVGDPLFVAIEVRSTKGTPTGHVVIRSANTTLATFPLVDGRADGVVTLPNADAHTLVAYYTGDATFDESASTNAPIVHVGTRSFVGGGCSSSGGTPVSAALLAFLAVLALRVRPQWRLRIVGLPLVVAVTMGLPLSADAQGFDAHRYHAAAVASDGLMLERPTSLGHGQVGGALTLSYAHRPLTEELRSADGRLLTSRALIDHQLVAAAGVAVGLWDRLTLHAILPVTLVQTGSDTLTSTALGDLRLGARIRILGGLEGEAPSRFGLGLEGQVFVPTGKDRAFASDNKARGRVLLLAEGLPAHFLYVGANIGVMLRPEVEHATNLGHALLVGGSVGYRTAHDTIRLGLEANSDIALVTNTPSAASNAVEAYAVGSFRFLDGLHASVGVGPGFTDTSGTPSVRAIARIGWARNAQKPGRPAPRTEDDIVATIPEDVSDDTSLADAPPAADDLEEQTPQPPVTAPVDNEPTAKALTDIPTTIRFEYDGTELAPGSDAALQSVARQLHEHPDTRISVEGHCDDRGTDALNDALSVRRADVVRRALVRYGVPNAQLEVVGHGKRRPIADNTTDEGRAQNRRVEFVVKGR